MNPGERDREAAMLWHAEHRERLVAALLEGRPAEFARPGVLHPDLDGWARQVAAGLGQNLIVTGPVGAGKTWALWRAAEVAVRAGYAARVVVTTAARFRRVIAPSTADRAEWDRYCAAGLLAVDDVGAFGLSGWDLDHLGELVDLRWSRQQPTAVASNKTDLAGLLGPRISSRLQHRAVIVEFGGPDPGGQLEDVDRRRQS